MRGVRTVKHSRKLLLALRILLTKMDHVLAELFVEVLDFIINHAEFIDEELNHPDATPPFNMAEVLGLPVMNLMAFIGQLEEEEDEEEVPQQPELAGKQSYQEPEAEELPDSPESPPPHEQGQAVQAPQQQQLEQVGYQADDEMPDTPASLPPEQQEQGTSLLQPLGALEESQIEVIEVIENEDDVLNDENKKKRGFHGKKKV